MCWRNVWITAMVLPLFMLSGNRSFDRSLQIQPIFYKHPHTMTVNNSLLLERMHAVAHYNRGERNFVHQWLSPHSLLMVHAVFDESINAELVNTNTGKHQPLVQLNKFLKNIDIASFISLEASCDGKWLLENDRSGAHLMRLDGSGLRNTRAGGRCTEVKWLDDGIHWIDTFLRGGIRRYGDVEEDYDEFTLYSRLSGMHGQHLTKVRSDINEVNTDRITGVSYVKRGMFLCYASPVRKDNSQPESKDQYATHIVIRYRQLTSTRKPTQVSKFSLPYAGHLANAAFSPSHRRLAWMLWAKGRVTIYTSALDGTRRQAVGSVRCECPDETDHWDGGKNCPSDLMWLPDDKSLSFVYQGTIYLVPAS